MKLKEELAKALSLNTTTTQISPPWIFIVALGVLAPLLVGIFRGDTGICIFGGLTGYMFGLCTEVGPLKHRLKVVVLAFLCIAAAFSVGLLLQHSLSLFFIASAIIVYTVGIIAGKGAEVERMMVLGGVTFFIARYTALHIETDLSRVFTYILSAFAAVFSANIIASLIWPFINESHVRIRQSISHLKTLDRVRHYYAVTYVSAVLLAMALAEWFAIERGYWMVITVLLMMRPTKRESFQRVVQRTVGTMMGVVLGLPLIFIRLPELAYAFLATLFAGLVTAVWKKNYWLVSLCATVFVICLLEVATQGELNGFVTLIRIQATVYGCLLSVAVIFLFHLFEPILLKSKKPE